MVFRVGACFEVLLFCPLFSLVPVLIGLLASVDVKQQKLIVVVTVRAIKTLRTRAESSAIKPQR